MVMLSSHNLVWFSITGFQDILERSWGVLMEVKHLGDIEAKDELEREEVLVLVTEDAELLKPTLHLLVLADQPPVRADSIFCHFG